MSLGRLNVEERKQLIRVALGKEKASLVIIGGNLVDVYSGELLEGISVAVKGDRVAFVGRDANHTIGEGTEVINASGKIMAPGFVDSHFHLDMPLDEFLEHAMPHGTTTVFVELDLGRILGYEVATAELANMQRQPIKLFGMASFYMSPPPFLEQQSLALSTEEYQKLLDSDDVVALGECTWTGVVDEDDRALNNIVAGLARKKTAEGHGAGAKNNKLAAFIASGISSCHESIDLPEAMEKLRLGLYVMIREGSVRRDLESISGIKDKDIDFRRLCLVTDGLTGEGLLSLGHMDYIVQKAIDLGIPPIRAFQMATLNPIEHFGMGDSIGGIAPGRFADMVILPSLSKVECEYVISNGKIVAKNGNTILHPRGCAYPESMLASVHVPHDLQPDQFAVLTKDRKNRATVRVIKLVSELITQEYKASLPVVNSSILPDPANDIIKVSLIERINNTGKIVTEFVQGFGLRTGSFASSYSWDLGSPLVAVGTNDEDMAVAINRVIELQGGLVVAENGIIQAELPLKIGGFIALGPIEKTNLGFKKINETLKKLGCSLANPFVTLMTVPGTYLPFFRITLQGLVDLKKQKVVNLVIE